MPKAKRATVVSLTRVKSKRIEQKSALVTAIQACTLTYPTVIVFAYDNMRANKFKNIRTEWIDSRFFLGKNRVMEMALLQAAEQNPKVQALAELAGDLSGQVGLLFTKKSIVDVEKVFQEQTEADFARAGFIPNTTLKIPAGKLENVPHSMAEWLQHQGMNVRLERGVIVVAVEYTLCTTGIPITPDQGKLLKYFGHKLAIFRLRPIAAVSKGIYKVLSNDAKNRSALETMGTSSVPVRRRQKERKPAQIAPNRRSKKSHDEEDEVDNDFDDEEEDFDEDEMDEDDDMENDDDEEDDE
jgi:mRNA turnover protein 4